MKCPRAPMQHHIMLRGRTGRGPAFHTVSYNFSYRRYGFDMNGGISGSRSLRPTDLVLNFTRRIESNSLKPAVAVIECRALTIHMHVPHQVLLDIARRFYCFEPVDKGVPK